MHHVLHSVSLHAIVSCSVQHMVHWLELLRFSQTNFKHALDTDSKPQLQSAVVAHLTLTKKRLRNVFLGITQRLVQRLSPREEHGAFIPYGKENTASVHA